MASLMYGAGLRLMECLRLRVQDVDFARNEITVRDGKGAKDRITMLPESLKTPLQDHLETAKEIHERDLTDGWGRVQMPTLLTASTPTPPQTGAGNGSFRRKADGGIAKQGSRAAIMWMSPLSRRP